MSNNTTLNNVELTMALNIVTKKQAQLGDKLNDIIEIQKRQELAIEKQNVLLEQLHTGSSNNVAAVSSNFVDNETLILKIKEVLLDDEEILETFNKVIENVTTYNHNKDKVNEYIDSEREKRKSKKPIFVIIVFAISLIALILYFIFSSNKTITIPVGTAFYELNKKDELGLPKDLTVEILDEDELRYYFKIKNKKYYINKAAIK